MKKKKEKVAAHIILAERLLQSRSETGSNGQQANVVDGLFAISRAIHTLASSVRLLAYKTEKVKDEVESVQQRRSAP